MPPGCSNYCPEKRATGIDIIGCVVGRYDVHGGTWLFKEKFLTGGDPDIYCTSDQYCTLEALVNQEIYGKGEACRYLYAMVVFYYLRYRYLFVGEKAG
jgi:hypothetical protein